MDLIPGYTMEKVIFDGGRFDICIAKQISSNSKKLIKKTSKEDPSVDGLSAEFEILKELFHPNIVHFTDIIRFKQNVCLVSDFFDGIPLTGVIPRTGLDLDVFLSIAVEITKGLVAVHESNIVHQSICPKNILVNMQQQQVKLWGFEKATYNTYITNADLLSFSEEIDYISPEQTGRMNRFIDYRTDFYSLGLVFYYMLMGNTPFQSEDPLEVVHWHIAKEIQPLQETNPKVPLCISKIVSKLLAKNCPERYQSATGVLFDLQQCQAAYPRFDRDIVVGQKDLSRTFSIPQKLYGREIELARLRDKLHCVSQGDTIVVMVTGYSGIGKSAIVNELQKDILIKDAYFAAGKYESKKKNVSYSAISAVFQDLFRQILGETDTRIERWRESLQSAVGENGQVIIDIIPELELIIGKQPAVQKLGVTESQNRFNMVFQKFVAVFDTLAHPLVIFLDDLQWIDLASLSLIKLLVSEHLTKSFLFIGAYRSNEVDPSHPVSSTIADIKNTGVAIEYIHLQPLELSDINCWTADSFRTDLKSTQALSQLLINKTDGNPFFVKSFLQNLHDENLIRFNRDRWDWDIDEIVTLQPTDNVTELMANNIKKLSQSSRSLLMLASCIGTDFSLQVLSIISQMTPDEVEKCLKPALASGMIVRQKQHYRFIHDKILEAAYAMFPAARKKTIHLKTGRLLLSHLSEEEIETDLFDVVEHFNIGASLILEEAEKKTLQQLNIRAAQKALNSSAYKNAGHYYKIVCDLMSESAWQTDYQQTLEVYSQWAEAEYMSSNFDHAEQLFSSILKHTTTLVDKCKIYQMILIYNENRKRFREAVHLSVKVVNELGIQYPHPETVTASQIEKQRQRLLHHLDTFGVESLSQLPLITDSVWEAAIGVWVSVVVPYWNTYPNALPFLCYEIVNCSIEHGLCSKASIGFSMIGSILAEQKQTAEIGYQIASLAVSITDRFHDSYNGTAVKYMFYNHVVFWKKSLKWGLHHLINAFHTGIETGNIQWASYCLNHYSMRLLMAGDPLEEVKRNYDKYTEPMYRMKQQAPLTFFNPPRQATDCLLGLVDEPCVLKGNAFDEEIGLASFYETKQYTAVGLTYIFKLFLYCVFEEFEKAYALALKENCETYIRSNTGQFQPYLGLCFYSLALLENWETSTEKQQRRILKNVETICAEFKQYHEMNPFNFSMLYYLLSAEIHRVRGDYVKAFLFFDDAIEVSKNNNYLHIGAIANERCAAMWRQRGKLKVADGYIHEAYQLYKKWGCRPKVRILEEKYPSFVLDRNKKSSVLDVYSVQKATLAISSHIHTDNLLKQLVQIIIETAGAQKGFIILCSDQGPFIEAGFDIEKIDLPQIKHQSLENTHLVAEDIVRYVIRTGENVILQDACKEGEYKKSHYIQENQSRSVLAMPIIFKNKIHGALFLENNLTSHVFSKERIELFSFILSQAAISLENARLYNDKVEAHGELFNLQNFLSNIIDSMSSILIGIDPQGIVTQWNKKVSTVTGVDASNAVGQPLKKVFPRLAVEMNHVAHAINTRQEYHDNRRMVLSNDEQRFEDFSIFPLLSNTVEGAVIRLDDVTERVRIEEMVVQSDKMLSVGGLAAGMAHEINNPLGGIMQTSEVLIKRLTSNSLSANISAATQAGTTVEAIQSYMEQRKIIQMLQLVHESGLRASKIVSNMLSFARKPDSSWSAQNMAQLLDQTVELAESDFDYKKKYDFRQIKFIRDYEDNLPCVICEPGKIQQVLLNILCNGAQAMQEELPAQDENFSANSVKNAPCFKLGLKYNSTKQMIYIEIEDNGPGMKEEVRKRIFEPFFTTKSTERGTGLGLSISYFIITENHNGQMFVESKQGQGTRFIIGLPSTGHQSQMGT